MLNKKQNIKDNQDWLDALEKSTEIYSREEIHQLACETAARIFRVMRTHNRACSGWCGGKDSLVLEHILRSFAVPHTPIMWRGINEYPAQKAWIDTNKPATLIEEVIDKYNLDFLEANPEYLFCKGKTRTKWMATKWQRQRRDIEKHGFDLFITGRRRQDGNICGSVWSDFVVNKPKYDVLSPLAEWNGEQLLAYIKYNDIELPPFYSWDRGFLIGSIAMGEWTERAIMDKTEDEVWEEIHAIDKTIVENASKTLTSARNFLAKKGKTK